jgi:hypothetical protein
MCPLTNYSSLNKANNMTTQPNNKSVFTRNLLRDWIIELVAAAYFLYQAVTSWNNQSNHANFRDWWWGLAVVLAVILASVKRDRSMKRSWTSIAQMATVNEPRDEREWRLYEKSGSYALTVTYGLTICLMITLYFVPSPSSDGMFNLLIAFLDLQLLARGFIYWLIGAR